MAAPPKEVTEDDHTLERFEAAQQKDELEGKASDCTRTLGCSRVVQNLQQLDELEDEVDEDILETYRARRLAELQVRCLALLFFAASFTRVQAQAARNVYGEVRQISEPDFMAEVSKAPADVWVVLHLFVAR